MKWESGQLRRIKNIIFWLLMSLTITKSKTRYQIVFIKRRQSSTNYRNCLLIRIRCPSNCMKALPVEWAFTWSYQHTMSSLRISQQVNLRTYKARNTIPLIALRKVNPKYQIRWLKSSFAQSINNLENMSIRLISKPSESEKASQ